MARLLALHGPIPDHPGPREPDDPGSVVRDGTPRRLHPHRFATAARRGSLPHAVDLMRGDAATFTQDHLIPGDALPGAAIPFVETPLSVLPVRDSLRCHACLRGVAANTQAGPRAARHRFA